MYLCCCIGVYKNLKSSSLGVFFALNYGMAFLAFMKKKRRKDYIYVDLVPFLHFCLFFFTIILEQFSTDLMQKSKVKAS